jgi:hypothetical protein
MAQRKQVLRVVKLYASLLATFMVFLLVESLAVVWVLVGGVLTALMFHAVLVLHIFRVLPLAIVWLIGVLFIGYGAVRSVYWLRRLVHLFSVGTRLLEPDQTR